MLYVIAAILAAVGVTLILVGKSRSKLKSAMEQTPTTLIGQLAQGQYAEIKGSASCEQPLQAPEAGTACVYYSYHLKRRERRRDSSGRTRYHWRTIDSGSSRVPFTLADSTGKVTVDPDGAKIDDAPVVVDRYVQPGEKMTEGVLKTVLQASTMLTGGHRQKIEVRAIPVGRQLYILGDVQHAAGDELRVAKGDNKFLISTKSEEQLMRSLGRQRLLFNLFGAGAIIGGIILLVLKFLGKLG